MSLFKADFSGKKKAFLQFSAEILENALACGIVCQLRRKCGMVLLLMAKHRHNIAEIK